MLAWGLTERQRELLRWIVQRCEADGEPGFDYSHNPNAGPLTGDVRAGKRQQAMRAEVRDVLALRDTGFVTLHRITYGGGEGAITQRAVDAVRADFAPPTEPLVWYDPMAASSLTPAQKLLAIRLARRAGGNPIAISYSPAGADTLTSEEVEGPTRRADVDAIGAAGLAKVRWHGDGVAIIPQSALQNAIGRAFGIGRERLVLEMIHALAGGKTSEPVSLPEVSSLLGFDAGLYVDRLVVKQWIEPPTLDYSTALTDEGKLQVEDPTPPAAAPAGTQINQTINVNELRGTLQAVASGTAHLSQGADAAELLRQVRAMTAELVAALREALPGDDGDAAARDAEAVAAELEKDKPDPDTVAKKTRSILSRINDNAGSATELIERGEKIGGALLRFGPYVAGAWAYLKLKAGMG